MLDKLKHITTFIFDVDGVLTDGNILVTENGEQWRTFNTKDGYAMQLAIKKGYNICVISGGTSQGILKRLNGLGINDIFLGIHHKKNIFDTYIKTKHLQPKEIVFVGDDVPDLAPMLQVGLAVCPADAVQEIKEISHYISPYKGGAGVARDIIEKILKIQDKWLDNNPDAGDGGKF
ncbi:MAG: 3-deoxy-D-manno-octulosonate 8-phosphate phosphatase [Sphingobacteriales bacterium]|nr:MAG: 3-deoxy-D-manno-octulosonate 8-phosphate phosphatase [Sphingobacteriales bacterium]TAF80445.1 MAG: 3-deoxy-D-manno-octulosonate 8-phosphate phosphatase [Sphingobacteriales bacterium]